MRMGKEKKKAELQQLKKENEELKQELEIAKLQAENRELREEIDRLRWGRYGTTTITYQTPKEGTTFGTYGEILC